MYDLSSFGLKENPFRMTPNIGAPPIWAGFPSLKRALTQRINFSFRLSNSSLVLNWGAYGSGKTHAANYFTHKSVLEELSRSASTTIPFSLKISLPKGKNPTQDFFNTIIDYINIEDLRTSFSPHAPSLNNFIDSISSNNHIRAILKNIFCQSDIAPQLMKSYLYNNITPTDLRNSFQDYNILRKLHTDDDFIQVLAGIFSCLTYGRHVFSSVIIWIDEFESISTLSHANIGKTNHFIRELIDNAPNHLLLFLNFTLSAIANLEDLSLYLDPSVMNRIKTRINLEPPNADGIRQYLQELLQVYRTDDFSNENIFHPFEQSSINLIIVKLQGSSLRTYNEVFSSLLELAMMDNKDSIDSDFVELYESELIWK